MDKKISELPSATTVGSSDLAVLVQNLTTKNVSVATLFANIPVIPVVKSVDILTTNGTVSKYATRLSNSTNTRMVVILPDATDVTTVYLVCENAVSPIDVTCTGADFNTVTFTAVGQLAKLAFIGGKWYAESLHGASVSTT